MKAVRYLERRLLHSALLLVAISVLAFGIARLAAYCDGSNNKDKYRGESLRAAGTFEFCPKSENFTLAEAFNRDSRCFPPKPHILRTLALCW